MIGNLLNSDFLTESVGFAVKDSTCEMDVMAEMYDFLIEADKEFTDMKINAYKKAMLSENSEEVLHEGVVQAIKSIFQKIIDFIKNLFSKMKKEHNSSKMKEFERLMKIDGNKEKVVTVTGYKKYSDPGLSHSFSLDALKSNEAVDTLVDNMKNIIRAGQDSPEKFKLNYEDGKKYVEMYDNYISYNFKKNEADLIKTANMIEKQLIADGIDEKEAADKAQMSKTLVTKICAEYVKATGEYKKTVEAYLGALRSNKKEEDK